MKYILMGTKSSGEFYYFKTLEEIQKHIEATTDSSTEYAKMRIFKLEREIDVNNLFGPQQYA